MARIILKNCKIVNENRIFTGSIIINGNYIEEIIENPKLEISKENDEVIDLSGKIVIPGVIDDQVHFREPGLTHKGEIYTEAKAAIAGGVTSYMEMPNCNPQTTTQELLEEKYKVASQKSLANYSFYMGATNSNIEELRKTNPENVCGIKIFMGSSTGNMLVDNKETLEEIFSTCNNLIAVHCEDEATIKANTLHYTNIYGENIPVQFHPEIRNHEACAKSSAFAIELAKKFNTRLHILHLSTAQETTFFNNSIPLHEKRITAEVCAHHLWFNAESYQTLGTQIKCNPAVKQEADRKALFAAMLDNRIDVIATDHAPHTWAEKQITPQMKAPSGVPLVQHSLQMMMEFWKKQEISLEKVVEKMCHAPATLFRVKKRGYIKPGYFADLVVIDPEKPYSVTSENILYKCGWSPFLNQTFSCSVYQTYVNGNLVFANGIFNEENKGMRLEFDKWEAGS